MVRTKTALENNFQPGRNLLWEGSRRYGIAGLPKDRMDRNVIRSTSIEWHSQRMVSRTIYLDRLTDKCLCLCQTNWICYALFELLRGIIGINVFFLYLTPGRNARYISELTKMDRVVDQVKRQKVAIRKSGSIVSNTGTFKPREMVVAVKLLLLDLRPRLDGGSSERVANNGRREKSLQCIVAQAK